MRTAKSVFLLLFALTTGVWAQPDSQPSVIKMVDPEYSDIARTAGVHGAVLLKLTVEMDGKPSNIRVARSLGYGLDEKAVESVARWTFRPAMQNGVAVSKIATIEISFALITNGRGALGPLTFALEPGTSRPILTEVDMPPAFGPTEVTMEFDVAPSGLTENYKVTGAASSTEEKAVLEALRKWKFQPAIHNGSAVAARGKVSYSVQ